MPYLNRFLCDVLDEMRKACETMNFSYLPGLIEEAQTMGNRMEAKLNDGKDYEHIRESTKKLEEKKKALELQIDLLKKQKSLLKNEEPEEEDEELEDEARSFGI